MSSSPQEQWLDSDPAHAWYFPNIERGTLRALMTRSDARGLLQFGTWLAACVAGGYGVAVTLHSFWIVPAELVYGIILSFAYAASHECAHGTAFRTRWLNEVAFWLTSVVFMEEAVYRRYAHADHHTYTWFNGSDPQKPYGIPLRLGGYLKETIGVTFYLDAARRMVRHAMGRFDAQEQRFMPVRERGRVRLESLFMLACYGGLLAWGALARTPWPFVLYFLPRFLGGCFVNLYINTQHMCMAEDLRDHRLTTRSIRCSAIEGWLYWNMHYHIEHHLYPAVPFHALPALNAQISSQLPEPAQSVWHANCEILQAIQRQRDDPDYNLSNRGGGTVGVGHRAVERARP